MVGAKPGNQNAKKTDDDKCTVTIKIMVTPPQHAELTARAKALRMTIKRYLLGPK